MEDRGSIFERAFHVPEHVAGALRDMLPDALSKHIDLTAAKLVPVSFVGAETEHRPGEMLFSVPLLDRPSYVYFLLEKGEPALSLFEIRKYKDRVRAKILAEDPARLGPNITIVGNLSSSQRPYVILDERDKLPEPCRFVPDVVFEATDVHETPRTE